jgi:hypothetical protein
LFGIFTPFGVGKLAQEGRALARKRNSTNFLASVDLAGAAFIVGRRSGAAAAPNMRDRRLRFPLTAPTVSWRIIKWMRERRLLERPFKIGLNVASCRPKPHAAAFNVSISDR